MLLLVTSFKEGDRVDIDLSNFTKSTFKNSFESNSKQIGKTFLSYARRLSKGIPVGMTAQDVNIAKKC